MPKYRVAHVTKNYYDVEADDYEMAIRKAQDSHLVEQPGKLGVIVLSGLQQNNWNAWNITP